MQTAAPTPRNRNKHPPLSKQGPGASPMARSKVSNGRHLFADSIADGRTGWSRRMRDLIAFYVAHMGGEEITTIAERSIVRRVATLEIELEWLERTFAISSEGASPDLLDLYSRTTNTLRRLLESIGLQRRSRDVTPETIDEIAADIEAKKLAEGIDEDAAA